MKPAPPEPADLVPRLRQQLILAQVRIMELEDAAEALAPRLAELEKLLAQAQTLADRQAGETAHLGQVLADTQAHAAQLHTTGLKLAEDLTAAVAQLAQRETHLAQLEATRRGLEAELQAMKSSRRWRWTAWLRSLGGP
jgi:chromosome segregation ATPase